MKIVKYQYFEVYSEILLYLLFLSLGYLDYIFSYYYNFYVLL